MPGVSRFLRANSLLAMTLGSAGLVSLPLIAVRPISDPSPWLHLKVGQYLAAGGRFSQPDPWGPFARGGYEPTQWLPSVIASGLYDYWGLPAVAWLRAVGLIALLLTLIATLARTYRPLIAVVCGGVAVTASWPWLTERPQLLGFVLLVPAIGAWWWTSQDLRPRWWLVPLTWIGAMSHGVWAMGPAIGGLVIVGLVIGRSASRGALTRLIGVLGASLAAAACTPLGPSLLLSPLTVGENGRQFVLEWMPSSARTPAVALTLLMLAATWFLWIQLRVKTSATLILLFVAAVAFTLAMQRTVPVGAILAALLLGDACDAYLAHRRGVAPESAKQHRTLVLGWITAALISAGVAIPVAAVRGDEVRGVPEAMTASLDALPRGARVLAFGDLTGWIMFEAPQVEPVFDLRIEQYSPGYVRSYITAMKAESGWQKFVGRTGAEVALLEDDSPLAAGLTEQLGWTLVQRDAGYVLLEQTQ